MEHKIEKIVVCQIEEKSLTENTDIEILQKEMGTKRKKKKKERKYPTKESSEKRQGGKTINRGPVTAKTTSCLTQV